MQYLLFLPPPYKKKRKALQSLVWPRPHSWLKLALFKAIGAIAKLTSHNSY